MAYDEPDGGDASETEAVSDSSKYIRMFQEWDRNIMDSQSQWAVEARLCYSMVAGGGTIFDNEKEMPEGQWDKEAVAALLAEGVRPIEWNRIGPLVDAVSGAQIQNRHEVKYYPREVGDTGVNEVLTAAAEWAADEGDFEDEETDAFFDTLTCGLGWTETYMCYDVEPDGEIKKDRVDPLEMRWDPMAQKRNLADARYFRRTRPYSKEEFEEKFPEWKDRISGLGDDEEPSRGRTDPGDDYTDPHGVDTKHTEGEILVREYQWYELEPYVRMMDTLSGAREDMEVEDYDRISAAEPERFKGIRLSKRVYYKAFCADDQLLGKPERLDCEGFTYHAITGKRDRNKGTWYGLVRAMIDPQRWANKWMTQILVIINKNAKGGVLVEKDAVEDLAVFMDEWARPDGVSVVEPGAIAGGKILPKQAIAYPEGLDRMIQMAISSIRDVTGINQELLGMVDRDQPGILEAQRKEAGYAMLSMFFDSLRRYRKMSGRLLLTFIQKYLPPETLIRIVGEEGGMKYVQLGLQDETKRFDVIVDEAPSGPNQKDKVWAMFVQMMPMLSRMNVPPQIWAEMVRHSPLPEYVSQKIIGIITAPPPPEAQQAQQMQQQLMQRNAEAEIKKTESEAAENMAQAQAAMADLPARQMEAQAAMVKHQSDAQSAQAKAFTAQVDAQRKQSEQALTAAKVELTEAQTAHQIVETAISQLVALRDTLSPESTEVRINT